MTNRLHLSSDARKVTFKPGGEDVSQSSQCLRIFFNLLLQSGLFEDFECSLQIERSLAPDWLFGKFQGT